MLKRILAVLAGFLFGVAVFAADVELREDHPDTYVVVKGDTLWDIAGRFLKHPWLWPEIWHANPQIENPHLIYPGDVISLAYLEGGARITAEAGGPRVRREQLAEAVTAIPLSRVQPFLEKVDLMTQEDIDRLPYVVGLEENRLRSTTGQLAYVRGGEPIPPGTRVRILRPTFVYRDVPVKFPWGSSEKEIVNTPWETDRSHTLPKMWTRTFDYRSRSKHVEYIGHEVVEVGVGEVLRDGDPSTVLVTYGDIEIKKGDLVSPTGTPPFDLSFFPRAPKSVPENMRVIAFYDALNVIGPNQVVALNRGAADGVENGQVYSIFHPGDIVRDEISYPANDLRTVFKRRRGDVELPEEFIGHVMVFRTFDRVSYGLVMDGIRPVHLLDVLHAPLE
jgi:hypothetical protein